MSNPLVMRVLLAVILAVCAVGAFLARAERAEVTIRIAFLASSDDEDYVGAMAFKQSVEAAAGGRVAVQVFPSGQYCGSERECIEALQGGMLEMHQTTFGGLAALFGPAQALDLPYTFADDAVAECVMDGPLLAQMGDAILEQDLGLRLMAVGNTGGWRSFATTRQRIQSPADLARLRIRKPDAAAVVRGLLRAFRRVARRHEEQRAGRGRHEAARACAVPVRRPPQLHGRDVVVLGTAVAGAASGPEAHRGRRVSRACHRHPRGG